VEYSICSHISEILVLHEMYSEVICMFLNNSLGINIVNFFCSGSVFLYNKISLLYTNVWKIVDFFINW